ncbi:peptide-methionine (S)-S-oxide reductase MsrA [Gammaproteobacteria bacterium]|nr:peptide-methionine (S)-S-oxide reductase MsrA [Gammaproteobacteria bacterium]
MLHTILNKPIDYSYSYSEFSGSIILGAGCFWGVERKFWSLPGVQMTSVGYAGGHAADPTYESVCSGSTGHTEVVKIQFDSSILSLKELLKIFWECHDPTQGNRQGNDIGTQYRSACFCENEDDLDIAQKTFQQYQEKLLGAGYGNITTEMKVLQEYYLAEEYHQQYLDKNPNGYCGIGGTGCTLDT